MTDVRRVCPSCGSEYGGDVLFCPRDGAPVVARSARSLKTGDDPYLGVAISGDILLERLTGMGAMGRVYRARQNGTERDVAVKILAREHTKDAVLVARFRREGRVAASLEHPHVVTVFGAGELPRQGQEGGGEPYLVMEFLDGLSLRSALAASQGPLPVERAVAIVLQVCDAMGEAHARGIVHRDLKPENIMLVRRGADPDFVKVLDFGVARVGTADSSIATHAGAVLGTAVYACPETARGELVGPPGDVYAITTMLFECLTGRTPFVGKSAVDVLIQHSMKPPPDVQSLRGDAPLPEALAEVIRRNLDKNPASRDDDARALGRSIAEAFAITRSPDGRVRAGTTLLGVDSGPPSGDVQVARTERKTLRNLGTRGGFGS